MEINLDEMTIAIKGNNEDIYALAKKISTKNVSAVVELLNETNGGLPRVLRTRALKMVLNDFVKIAKELPITTELLHRLNWYTEYSDYQLNKLFNTLASTGDTRFHENACSEQYKVNFWVLVLVNAESLNLAEDTIVNLTKLEDLHLQFNEFNEMLNSCLYDFPASIDVVPAVDYSHMMFKSSTVAELRDVAAKYEINVPKRLNRAQLLDVIVQRLKEDDKYDEAVHEKIKDMKVVSLQRFAKDNDIKASTELRKDAVIDFILKAVENGQANLKTNDAIDLIVLEEEMFEMKPEYIREIDPGFYYEFDEDGEIVSKSDIEDLKGEIERLREQQEAERERLNQLREQQEAAQNNGEENNEDLYAERVKELERQIQELNDKQNDFNANQTEQIETVVVETVVEEVFGDDEESVVYGLSDEGQDELQQIDECHVITSKEENESRLEDEELEVYNTDSLEEFIIVESEENYDEGSLTDEELREIYERKMELAQKEAELAEKEAELAQTAAEKEAELAEKEAELAQTAAEKEAELAERESELAQTAAEKEAELAERESELAQTAAEKEAELAEREAQLAEAEKETELSDYEETVVVETVVETVEEDYEEPIVEDYTSEIVYGEFNTPEEEVYFEESVYDDVEPSTYSEEIVYQPEESVYSENIVYQEESLYSENIVYQEEPMYSENIVYQEVPMYSENIVYQDTPIYSENIVYQEVPIYSENIVYQEEPMYSENIVFQEVPMYSENIVYQEAPVYGDTVTSEEITMSEEPVYENNFTEYVDTTSYDETPSDYEEQVIVSEAMDYDEDPYQDLNSIETVVVNKDNVDEVSFLSFDELKNYSRPIYGRDVEEELIEETVEEALEEIVEETTVVDEPQEIMLSEDDIETTEIVETVELIEESQQEAVETGTVTTIVTTVEEVVEEVTDRKSRFTLIEEKISALTTNDAPVVEESTVTTTSFDAEHLDNLFESNESLEIQDREYIDDNAGEIVEETHIIDELEFNTTPTELSYDQIDESLLTKKQLKAKRQIAKLEKEKAKVLKFRTTKDSTVVKRYKRKQMLNALKLFVAIIAIILLYLFIIFGGVYANENPDLILFNAWSFNRNDGFIKANIDVIDFITFGSGETVLALFGTVYEAIVNFINTIFG